jgi:hypothetical protein
VYLARWSIAGLLAGGALGVVVAWLKWDAAYGSLWLGPLHYKLHWAGVEAIFSLVLMIGWRLSLPGRAGGSNWAMAARGLVAVLAATNLLYHFPVLFAVAARLAEAGETSGERIGGAVFRQLMIEGETPAVAVHVVLASVAVAGGMLLGLSLRRLRRGDEAGAARIARWGGWWSLAPSVLQLPVGVWTLTTMPAAAQAQLMGESAAGILLFVAAVVAALWLINELAHLSMGEFSRSILVRAMSAMLITVVLMIAMQQQARQHTPIPAANSRGGSS